MTGPEHYRKAEEFLGLLSAERIQSAWIDAVKSGELATAMAAAQAHATLALAEAFTAAAIMRPEDRNEWDRATGRLS